MKVRLLEKVLEVYERRRSMKERRLLDVCKNEAGRYPAEILHYMDDNQISPDSYRLGDVLAEIFSRFGEAPTDWIYLERNCCFIVGPGGKETTACILRPEELRPHIVLLPYDFFERYDRNPRGATMVVLHEVAHGYLGHRATALPMKQQEELDAWKLAAKWYRSSDLARKQ